jgi:hypothetical protein
MPRVKKKVSFIPRAPPAERLLVSSGTGRGTTGLGRWAKNNNPLSFVEPTSRFRISPAAVQIR